MQGNSSPSDLLFPLLKQNHGGVGGHKFKDDSEVETIVTRWLLLRRTGITIVAVGKQ